MNKVRLRGTLKNVGFFYECKKKNFLKGTLEVSRESGTIDYIPVVMEDCLYNSGYESSKVTIVGDFRSRRIRRNNAEKNGLELYVFCKKILPSDGALSDFNEIFLIGELKSVPILRETAKGRIICDFIVLSRRNNLYRKDLIPCIAWYDDAEYISFLRSGDKIKILGRIQSREYKKMLLDESIENRIAYEVSAKETEVVENEECKDQVNDAE